MESFRDYMDVREEVAQALSEGKPVVALESTIIAHSPPVEMAIARAKRSEAIVRENGCVPATMAIIKGRIRVGLSEDEIEYMATSGARKCSRRDVAAMLGLKLDGATTVSGTMMFAALAGVPVFATGGIGGVHRGAQETFDISADLQELAKTNVAVIASGCKSILDTALTLEYLETMGVPVLGYKTDKFPNFYARESGFGVDYRVDSEEDVAHILAARKALGIQGGTLICNPIPEENALDYKVINTGIEEAVEIARKDGVTGSASTPYILARLYEITKGESKKANMALVFNNVLVASKIAKACARV